MERQSRALLVSAFATGIVVALVAREAILCLQQSVSRRGQRPRSVSDLDIGKVGQPADILHLEDNESVQLGNQPHRQDSDSHGVLIDAQANQSKRDIKDGIEGTIGNTPLIRIKSLSEFTGCDILAKAEFLNGAGNSPKDRVALSIIENVERTGLLTPYSGDTIYEGTVGSTGISLATICRARGYKAHIFMPSDQSAEKVSLLSKLGARVTRNTPVPIIDPSHFVNGARAMADAHAATGHRGRGLFADQFETSFNHLAHLRTTGPEIYAQAGGRIDAFVAGAGTGGTLSGVARYLKPRLPKCRIVLADPQGSGLYNKVKYGVMFASTEREGTRRRHQVDSLVEGIGLNRITANLQAGLTLVDDAVRVSDEQAKRMARWLVRRDGIFIGSSSAVNCVAAVKTALALGKGSTVTTILCDSGMRHLSRFWKDDPDEEADEALTLADVLAL